MAIFQKTSRKGGRKENKYRCRLAWQTGARNPAGSSQKNVCLGQTRNKQIIISPRGGEVSCLCTRERQDGWAGTRPAMWWDSGFTKE